MSAARLSAPLVTMTFWGIGPAQVPAALTRMALDRRHLSRTPGMTFAKLLGTGDGRTFTLRDADLLHWGLLTVWDDPVAATAFESGPTARAWRRLSRERLLVRLRPVSARGSWSGRVPFGDPRLRGGDAAPAAPRVEGPVAALTRARLRLRRARRFWSAVPAVSNDLQRVPGMRLAVGIGEAPIGVQGTFSIWETDRSLREFAYRRAPHRAVISRTAGEGWYVEELFARFHVESVTGTFRGREL